MFQCHYRLQWEPRVVRGLLILSPPHQDMYTARPPAKITCNTPNKLLQRLKKRNKTAPMSNDRDGVSRSPSLSLSGVPPLRAPWVSENMELEQEFLPPPPPPATQGGRIVKRGSPLLGMRLPKLAHQPASSASDISQLPTITGELSSKQIPCSVAPWNSYTEWLWCGRYNIPLMCNHHSCLHDIIISMQRLNWKIVHLLAGLHNYK